MVKTSQALEKLLSVYKNCDKAGYICNALDHPKLYPGFETITEEEVAKIRKWITRFNTKGGAFETSAVALKPTNEIERAFKRILYMHNINAHGLTRAMRIQFIEYCITHYRRYGQ